eukprot:CAMPEP_0183349092 /NCGR_PEP_ID=MMETSP0164_2-20130417/13390_1 /TAXON_ID=221442 /ORGANISM="Coccolithus pelagicus ssp braarudi, Strain PLY182g" /LENGTH=46 /DNA_ID= /DNA_START= /DNA_END= /DNA_ORIENTATION=
MARPRLREQIGPRADERVNVCGMQAWNPNLPTSRRARMRYAPMQAY